MERIKNRLIEILKEVDFNKLAQSLELSDVSIVYTWNRGEYLPSTENFVKLSNYFDYSLDYLLCRTDDMGKSEVKEIGNFCKNLNKFIKNKNTSKKTMKKMGLISDNNLFKWKKGSIPTPETLIKLADYLCVSIDELLGRE